MATKKDKSGSLQKRDFAQMQQKIAQQFKGLDTSNPGQWPLLPQMALFVLAAIVVVVVAWFALLSEKYDSLDLAENRENVLKEEYRDKLAQAVSLPVLLQQQLEVQKYVMQLEQQLPNKANMDVLLRAINSAGLSNNLEFEKLQAEPIIVREYYAEQPIAILVRSNSYEDIANFAADLAKLSRIVTLDNITLEPAEQAGTAGSGLVLNATLKTYRYMTQEEQAGNRQQTAPTRSTL